MEKKLCLCSMVKNESRIIKRMLDSTLGVVDFYSISDTGSTDDTIEIIKTWFKDNKVKGLIHEHVWKDFGHNRTLALKAARESFKKADFLLCIDADMVLINKGFNSTLLVKDSYLIMQESNLSKYYINRILSTKYDWRSVGVTHEYFAPFDDKGEKIDLYTPDKFHGIEIDDREDGGCKSDKFIRDEMLLKQGLKDEPNNIRYMYYYAQTLECLGKYDQAIHWYDKRSKSGGFEEERWYAIYKMGICYKHLGSPPRAIETFLRAYSERSSRAEPLFELAKYYRIRKKTIVSENGIKVTVDDEEFNNGKKNYNLCYMFAKQCIEITFPHNDILFVDKESNSYGPHFELSIICYYLGKYDEGIISCFKVLTDENAPDSLKETTRSNLKFYTDRLKVKL